MARPGLSAVPALEGCQVHHGRLRHGVQHLPRRRGAKLPVPICVVDAAAREAAFVTRNRCIGVIGTAATIRSRSYETVLRKLVPGVEITARPCPLFVPLVEAGYVDHSALDKQQVTRLVIAQYLAEVREAGVDTLILGCTHYPLIKEMIGWYMAGTSPSWTRPRPPPTIWSGRSASTA